jgi:predicted dehydrogenase
VKFLICGLGSIGLRHLKNLRLLGYSDIILYRTGKSTINESDVSLGLAVFTDLDQALCEKPDICIVSNPSSLHVSTAIKCAKAGSHLFIEKPLSNTLDGLFELNALVKEKKLITLITYQFRFHPHIRLLHDVCQGINSEYGSPVYASAEWSEYLPDWHPWEDYKKSYSARDDLGGGVFLTQVHPINYLSYLFGPIKNIIKSVHRSKTLGIEVDDVADSLIEFYDGKVAHVHVDYIQKPRVHKMKIVMDRGRFEWDCHANSLSFIQQDGSVKDFPNNGFERNDMFLLMLKEFIDCVESETKTSFTLSDAIHELEKLLG